MRRLIVETADGLFVEGHDGAQMFSDVVLLIFMKEQFFGMTSLLLRLVAYLMLLGAGKGGPVILFWLAWDQVVICLNVQKIRLCR